MLESLATDDDLRRFAGEDIEMTRAFMLIDMASAVARSYCGWSISRQESVTWTLPGTSAYRLLAPTLRLNAITSCSVNGTTLGASDYDWGQDGILQRAAGWGSGRRAVVVVADHGYTEVPGDVQAAVLNIAARAHTSPPGMLSGRIDDFAAIFARDGGGEAAGGVSLTAIERRLLDQHRIPGRVECS